MSKLAKMRKSNSQVKPETGDSKMFDGMDPIQLVDTGSTQSELNLVKDAIKVLESEKRPVTPIVIIGPARKGKSYLMNRLMGRSNGFPLGSTVCTKTKGFWLWVGDHPLDPKRCLVLLDVEGLMDPMKSDPTHDLKLFTQALVSSSMFIYNTQGSIDASALDGLHLAIKMADEIMTDNEDLGVHCPHFVWSIRDQFLKLVNEEGDSITPKQLLENCLMSKENPKGASVEKKKLIEDYNYVRDSLREFFPDTRRDCFVFPRPATDDKMTCLEKIHESELNPDFKIAADKFVEFVFQSAESKQIKGSALSGRAYANMFKKFLESVNNQSLCLKSTFQMIAQEENDRAFKMAIQKMKDVLAKIELPMSVKGFSEFAMDATTATFDNFVKDCINLEATPYLREELEKALKEMIDAKAKENLEASCKKCRMEMKKLFDRIDENIENYNIDGGYDHLKKDIDEIKKEYESACCKDDSMELGHHIVLHEFTEEKFITRLKQVCQVDKMMTEMKKKEEEQKLRIEKIQDNNKRLEKDFERQKKEAENDKKTAKINLKNATEKMEKDHKKDLEQWQKNFDNQNRELNGLKAESKEAQKEFQEMLKNQKKEMDERDRKHKETMWKQQEDFERKQNEMLRAQRDENERKRREQRNAEGNDPLTNVVGGVLGLLKNLF